LSEKLVAVSLGLAAIPCLLVLILVSPLGVAAVVGFGFVVSGLLLRNVKCG